MTTLVFDIECDNLLPTLTTIHCIAIQDLDTEEVEVYYNNESIRDGLVRLYHADCIVGHNSIGFDIPAIQRIYPRWKCKASQDTLVLSYLLSPLRQSHSLESYSNGAKVSNEDWSCLTHNMIDRCIIDTMLTTKLYKRQLEIITDDWADSIELEHQVARNHLRQLEAGVHVDVQSVRDTLACLDAELEGLRGVINDRLPYRMLVDKHQYKTFFNKKDGQPKTFVRDYLGI